MKPERDNMLRKVRVIVSDPYATDDSSSDEWLELPKPRKVKRIVHEITLRSQLSERGGTHCDGVKTARKKSPLQSKKPVGIRLRPSGKWAAEITNPITKTKKWLGTYETPEEAEKAYADKKVEYSEFTSSGPTVSSSVSVVSVNSQCLPSPASHPNKDVAAFGDLANKVFFSPPDFNDLQIPDLSFLGAEEDSMVSNVNGAELDFDHFLMDDESGHMLDDFSLLDSDINICGGLDNSVPSELPDCDFTDVELGLGDLKSAFC